MKVFCYLHLFFSLFFTQILIVGTCENRLIEAVLASIDEAVLASNHNLWFRTNNTKNGSVPYLTMYKWGLMGYLFHGHVFLM